MTDAKDDFEPARLDGIVETSEPLTDTHDEYSANLSDGATFDDRVLLPGVGIGGYRSFRGIQRLSPLRRVTLVAGQNNAGKSNVLRFLALLGSQTLESLEWSDTPQPNGPPLRYEIAHRAPTKGQILSRWADPGTWVDELLTALEQQCFRAGSSELIWVPYVAERPGANYVWAIDPEWLNRVAVEAERFMPAFHEASLHIVRRGSSPIEDVRQVIEQLVPSPTLTVALIGPFRQVLRSGPVDQTAFDINGTDLIRRLAVLQHDATRNYRESRAKFDAIVEFARNVFADDTINITVPERQDELQIHQQGRVLSLENLGSGIQQVLIIAAAATTLENTLVCIEEPELHLHPVLQRKLIRYLTEQTSNQYVIATHSAHLLDYENAAVMALRLDPDQGTLVRPATTAQHVSDLCHDLGYRPSDLIQANAVIWVEGPSDRIYVRKWIELVAPDEFIEGIHYAIMFYGGSLLSHLQGTDPAELSLATEAVDDNIQRFSPDVEDFISLRRLNRYSMILIDSDSESSSTQINNTKRRVREEFDDPALPGHAWITACRTIENYVPMSTLTAAIHSAHPDRTGGVATTIHTHVTPETEWQEPLKIIRTVSPTTSGAAAQTSEVVARKVEIAKAATQAWPTGNMPLDLEGQTQRVVAFIRAANEGDPSIRLTTSGGGDAEVLRCRDGSSTSDR